jgi:hypothetical protein
MLRFLPVSFLLVLMPALMAAQSDSLRLTGHLGTDLREASRTDPFLLAPASFPPIEPVERDHKSLWLAGGLSALVPGAGQIYAEAPWWRTALYATIEALGWTAYAVYNGRGNHATEEFQNYADAHWDVTRYITWVAANYQRWSDEQVDKQAASEALSAIYLSHDQSLHPWERVDFVQLNRLEKAVHGGFSHTLPPYGDQQYYEEIGKYAQYRSGWDDHRFDADTMLYAPEFTTQHNLDYVADREQANRYLGYAVWAVGGLVANHVASMIDAAFAARHYNLSLSTDIHGEMLPDGSVRPAGSVGLKVRF